MFYRLLLKITFLTLCFLSTHAIAAEEATATIPILTYHRLAPTAVDSMTLPVSTFEAQLQWLKENGYTVIPLRTLVDYLLGKSPAPAPKSVVITADDGHKSVYTYMLPLVRKYHIPVTLFIYPSSISKASYALTWEQLQELKKIGLFDLQGHTYWHPNFHRDKKKLTPEAYQALVVTQLNKSKTVLEKKFGTPVDLLAWPFGIYDDELEHAAKNAGYVMAFSIDGRDTSRSENDMAQPRYMIVDQQSMKNFAKIMRAHDSSYTKKKSNSLGSPGPSVSW